MKLTLNLEDLEGGKLRDFIDSTTNFKNRDLIISLEYPKKGIEPMAFINTKTKSQIGNILIFDLKKYPDFEKAKKEAIDNIISSFYNLHSISPEIIITFNKAFIQKQHKILNNKSQKKTPWYDKFIKKGKRDNHRTSKFKAKKKGKNR